MRDGTDEIARMLEAAAADAPRSPRQELLRAALLDSVPSRRSNPFLAPLAVAAVVLLGVLLAVGAPAVGSMISDMLDRSGPTPALPDPAEFDHPTNAEEAEDAPRMVAPPGDATGPKRPFTHGTAAPPPDGPPSATPSPAQPAGEEPPDEAEADPPVTTGPPVPVPAPPVITPSPTGPPSAHPTGPPPGVPAP